jgi:hypothetical protein
MFYIKFYITVVDNRGSDVGGFQILDGKIGDEGLSNENLLATVSSS